MPSDRYIGTLLKSLIASKQASKVLELGTGISLSLAWMIEGLDNKSQLTSIDNDPNLISIAEEHFAKDQRVSLICEDGGNWIENNAAMRFDLIFADAWPGKYSHLTEVLSMINPGGFYVIDDMNPQPNWPEGHAEKAQALVNTLEKLENFTITKLDWSTGVIICTKQP